MAPTLNCLIIEDQPKSLPFVIAEAEFFLSASDSFVCSITQIVYVTYRVGIVTTGKLIAFPSPKTAKGSGSIYKKINPSPLSLEWC